MNGLVVLLIAAVGAVIGQLHERLRAGGTLDLRQCLATSHKRAGLDGCCPRCRTRIVLVAP